MAAPDIILGKGQVLLTQGQSTLGIMPISKNVSFGQIALLNDLSDNYSVGVTVMFNPNMGSAFIYGSTVYTIIDEQYISGAEEFIP